MLKVILFDCDGPIIKREKYFSQRLEEDTGVAIDTKNESSFFRGEFLECEAGKADLKEVLPKWLSVWHWQKSVDDLLTYWFEGERVVDRQMIDYITELRQENIKCYLSTNNEKYRTEYLTEEVGLKNYLDGVFSSCYIGFLKPDLRFWESIFNQFKGVTKDEVLVLDDKISAVDSAREFRFNAEHYESFGKTKAIFKEKYQI